MRRLIYRYFVRRANRIADKLRENGIEHVDVGHARHTPYGIGVMAMEALHPRLAKL